MSHFGLREALEFGEGEGVAVCGRELSNEFTQERGELLFGDGDVLVVFDGRWWLLAGGGRMFLAVVIDDGVVGDPVEP